MKQWRAPLYAGLIFVVALCAWLWDERRQVEIAHRQLLQESVFGIKSADEVKRVILVTPAGAIAGEKRGDDWRLTRPASARGDNDVFRALLENFIFARRRNEFEITGAVALANYGLDQPVFELTFETEGAGAIKRTVLVGHPTTTGDYYAMMEGGETIFILSEHLRNNLVKTPFDFRNRRVFAFAVEQATALSIDNTTGTLRIAQSAEGWRIEEPSPFPAEAALVESLLAEISGVRAVDFVDTQTLALSDYGLDPPRATIDITLGGANPTDLKIFLGERALTTENRWAYSSLFNDDHGRPKIVQLPGSFWETLSRDPSSYRRQRIFSLSYEEIDKVDVQTGDERFGLEKSADGVWRYQGLLEDLQVDQQEVELLLTGLLDLTAKNWKTDNLDDLTSHGLDAPLASVALFSASANTTETLAVGEFIPVGDIELYARLEQYPAIFTIGIQDSLRLFWVRQDFMLKKLFTFKPEEVAKIKLVGEDQVSTVVLEKTGRTWKMQVGDNPEKANVPAVPIENLARQFADLRFTTRLVRPPVDEESMGLTSPTLTMTAYNEVGDVLGGFAHGPEKGQYLYVRRHNGDLFRVSVNRYISFYSALGILSDELRKD
jgi:hypothetical protein